MKTEQIKEIIHFFDSHALNWDSGWKEEEFLIMQKILKRSGLSKQDIVLDVACGTGILVPFYLDCGVPSASIYGIDISPKMVEVFSAKFPDIKVECGDFITAALPKEFFTYAMIFNSSPHFLEPEKIFEKASQILKKEGKLVIAHSKTREEVDKHHNHVDGVVKIHKVMDDSMFLAQYQKYGFSKIILDNTDYFYTIGIKK